MKIILTYSLLLSLVLAGCKSNRSTTATPGGGATKTDTVHTQQAPQPTENQMNPQFEAARKGDLVALKTYLAGGGDVNILDPYRATLLHAAADGGQEDIAAFLMDKGISPNAVSDDGFTPLHNCALHGDSATAELLIKKGSEVFARDNNQMTPLHLCGLNNNVGVAKVLVAHGADVNDVNKNQWTPLRVAEYGKSADVAAFLKSKGAKE
jgi:ankyrin repeat protein